MKVPAIPALFDPKVEMLLELCVEEDAILEPILCDR